MGRLYNIIPLFGFFCFNHPRTYSMDAKVANKIYTTFRISENIAETPEGFLLCKDVPILRSGDLLYAPDETSVTPVDGPTVLSRTVEEIHRPETMASFEGKPITLCHPEDEFVTPENWKKFSVGVVQNVRPGEGEDEDKLICDLLITDAEAIEAVRSKRLRQVSGAYDLMIVETGPGKGTQTEIIGNHVALVAKGRAGKSCAIFDHETVEVGMSLKDKVLGIFSRAFDEADPAIEAVEVKTSSEELADAVESNVAEEQNTDAVTDSPDTMGLILERLSVIESALLKIIGDPSSREVVETADAGAVGETQVDAAPEEVLEAEEKLEDKCMDAETISRAEILAPGVGDASDVIDKSLSIAYKTEEGKAIIDGLLSGRSFDSADKTMLFVAASLMMKDSRKDQVLKAARSFDAAKNTTGPMTAEKLNEINASIYNTK